MVCFPDHDVEGVICYLSDLPAITTLQVDVVPISSMRKQQRILEGIVESMELGDMLQLPIPVLEYNVLVVSQLIRHEYANLIADGGIEPSDRISWGTSLFIGLHCIQSWSFGWHSCTSVCCARK